MEPGIRVCRECYVTRVGGDKEVLKRMLRSPRGMEAAASLALRIIPRPSAAGGPPRPGGA
ncbi:MAG: hypothetical protein GSR80_000186 [Desulfurococcales archaeon]|nr:hypothetical protein [Desulfurococcales archaeon]